MSWRSSARDPDASGDRWRELLGGLSSFIFVLEFLTFLVYGLSMFVLESIFRGDQDAGGYKLGWILPWNFLGRDD